MEPDRGRMFHMIMISMHDTMNQYRTIKEDCINLERLSWTTLIQIPNLFCQQPDVQAIITLLPL